MAMGALSAPTYPCGFLGLSYMKALRNAAKQNLLASFMEERCSVMLGRVGRRCHTFMTNVLGQDVLIVGDPVNLQAIFATQFTDFGVGHLRQAAISGCIGHGIVSVASLRAHLGRLLTLQQFTQDAKEWQHSRALLRVLQLQNLCVCLYADSLLAELRSPASRGPRCAGAPFAELGEGHRIRRQSRLDERDQSTAPLLSIDNGFSNRVPIGGVA